MGFFDSLFGGGGESSNSQPVSQTVTQTNIPDYAAPYLMNVLGKADALTAQPFQPYTGERTAQFTPLQQQSYDAAMNLAPSWQGSAASGMALQAGQDAMARSQYDPSQFSAGNVAGINALYDPSKYLGNTPQMSAAQGSYNPNLQQFQMGPAERVSTQSILNPGTTEAYMSPYMMDVVARQQRDAQRQADIATTGRNAQAVGAGAFGGSRQAITDAEAAKNLALQKGDIMASGLQSAFNNAQQQFNTEQGARLQANLANQNAGINVGGQNLAAKLGVQQLGTNTGLQMSLANLSNQQQANVQNLAAQLQTQGMSAQQALQVALANQSSGMQAQIANQNAGLQAQQLGEQSKQFGANLGLQGAQTALSAAGQLGSLGQQQFGQEQAALGTQNQLGTQQQGQVQNILNNQYQEYLQSMNYPYTQLSYMSDLLRGTGNMPQQSTVYQAAPAPSTATQLGSLGLGAYGLSQMKKGGKVAIKNKRKSVGRPSGAGLADLAVAKMA